MAGYSAFDLDANLDNILPNISLGDAGDEEFAAIVQTLMPDGSGGDATGILNPPAAHSQPSDPFSDLAPSLVLPAEAEVDWSVLELYMEKHSVHLVTDDKEYVVSNLKKFTCNLCLFNRQTRDIEQRQSL